MTGPRPWRRRIPAAVAAVLLVAVVIGPWLAPYGPTEPAGLPFDPPSADFLLGTDVLGRDVLSRVLHGGWLLVGLAAASLTAAYLLALPLGLAAGLRPGLDRWIMRPVDAFVVLPWFLVLAVVATAGGAGALAVLVATMLGTVPWIVKIVRTATHDVAGSGFVEAATARGESFWRIALVEVLPQLRGVVLADAGVRITAAVSMVTVGSFLGLGLPPPTPDWALMITENREALGFQPWAVLVPAALIMVLVVSLNLWADQWAPGRTTGPGGIVTIAPARGENRILAVAGLTARAADGTALLEDVDLSLDRGRSLAVVGRSGAGKTTLALALLGAAPRGGTLSGSIGVGRTGARDEGRRTISYVPQDPARGLNPALRVGDQLAEVLRAHGAATDPASTAASLGRVGLPASCARRRPHELSGGQQQRVLIAMALLADPEVVVLDEPTTGLDRATQAGLVTMLAELRAAGRTSFVVVTHDLPAVADLVDDVLVLERGRVVEAAVPPPAPPVRPGRSGSVATATPVLEAAGVAAAFGGAGRHRVLEPVDLVVHPGECVAITGPSGSGKSTLARCLVGLHEVADGTVLLHGVPVGAVAHRTVEQRRAVQLVFQNPGRSLNPLHAVADEVRRPMVLLRGLDRAAATQETGALFDELGLPGDLMHRRPAELSGGQLQRVAIARALAAHPAVLVCDEITASLDPEAQDSLLELLDGLRRRHGLAIVFISHDEAAVERIADGVVDIGAGRLAALRTAGTR